MHRPETHDAISLRTWLTAVAGWIVVHGLGSGDAARSSVDFAYFDPGSGSFILQALLGVLAAVGVTTKLYWTRIKGMLGMDPPDAEEASEQKDADG